MLGLSGMKPPPSPEDNDQPPVLDYAGLGARYGISVVRDGAGYRVFVPRLSLTRSASRYLREMPGWKRIITICFALVFSMPLLRELFTSAPTLPGEGVLVLFLGVAFVKLGVWSIEGLELKLLQRWPKEELDCLASTLMELLARFG